MAPQEASKDIDMDLFVEDNAQSVQPPARIAARFYRKSSVRRRSSAQSSRCSSLSSRHSRSSALSCHGGPRSTHIAQHLRRASIIESRKARLADRAAHAEQVRLRAAAAKAANKTTYNEERAVAAQAAREKLLAEITARCEEEVRRAKKVARETREREAADHARRRDEMEEKFAEAAKRRSVYQSSQRRPRTTSLAAVEEKKINPVVLKRIGQIAAAKVIQRTWRMWRQRRGPLNFIKLGLCIPNCHAISFEDMTKLIAEESTILTARSLLKQLDLLDGCTDETAERGAVRIFLSSFMIVSHPVQVLSRGGNNAEEQELTIKGQALLDSFSQRVSLEAIAGRRPMIPKKSREQLQFLYNDYNAAFHTWKSRDLTVLLDVMVGSFVNLDSILQTTKDDSDGHVAEEYFQAVRQEQIKLLARLKKLAGPEEALSRVRTAVRKARRERARNERDSAPAEHVPRIASDSDVVLTVPTEPLTPPATPSRDGSVTESHASSYITKLGQMMTVLPSNREIAHEMQINGTYEVQQQPWTESRKVYMDTLRRSMRSSMQDGGVQVATDWTRAMGALIRDKLLNLISQRHPLYDRIDGFLDVRLIEQQCRNGAFSYESFFETVGNLVAQLCSPGRDDIVRSFVSDKDDDTIDRLFTLINILDLMTLDHVNFQFRMAARSVIEHGHEHEYGMFEHDLRDGKHNMEYMRRWWLAAKSNVPNANTNNAAYGNAIYSRGLVDLVLSNSAPEYSNLPETLRLDWVRILDLRARAFQLVAVASVLLTTKIRLRRNREALWTSDAERLKNLNLLSTDAQRIVSLIESGHMMPDSTKDGLLNFVNRVLPCAAGALRRANHVDHDKLSAMQEHRRWDPARIEPATDDFDDVFTEQIATFILKSLREHVFARLSATSTAEKVRITTSAPEILARVGMPEFVTDVGGMVELLERIKSVDLKAHGKWYDEVAASITDEEMSAR